MSWLYSQALVEEYLEGISSDGEQSVQLSGSHTQQAYCAPDKMMVFSRLSRVGMTYKPLMESRGEELLTLFREDFRAKISAPQGKAQELMEIAAECGEKWGASFTKYDPDSCLWKTHQCSLLEDLEPFSETWPQWGLMLDGECWELRTLEQSTKETESGLWPTPKAAPGGGNSGGANSRRTAIKNGLYIPSSINPNLYEWLMGWPLGWTDLKPLETDKSHFVQQLLGESSQEEPK